MLPWSNPAHSTLAAGRHTSWTGNSQERTHTPRPWSHFWDPCASWCPPPGCWGQQRRRASRRRIRTCRFRRRETFWRRVSEWMLDEEAKENSVWDCFLRTIYSWHPSGCEQMYPLPPALTFWWNDSKANNPLGIVLSSCKINFILISRRA